MLRFFLLNSDHSHKEVTLETYSSLSRGSVQLADETVEGCRVSTIFLGIAAGDMFLYETMVFGPEETMYQHSRKYETYDEAMQGHKETVANVKYHFMR